MQIQEQLAKELRIPLDRVVTTIGLLDDGNTIPFIARYRKEATGELDENQLRDLEERLGYLRNLEKRKEEVIRLISEQRKLTPELEAIILKATKLQDIEDLYLPYKPKRKTRASVAREKGLQPLAEAMLNEVFTSSSWSETLTRFVDEAKGVLDTTEALAGAQDILAEMMAETAENRRYTRSLYQEEAAVICEAVDEAKQSVFNDYYHHSAKLSQIPPHRVLAINRGEREGFLRIKLQVPETYLLAGLAERFFAPVNSFCREEVYTAVVDGYKRLMAPSIEREIRNELTELAEEQAIHIFATNLRDLLLVPPVKGKTVLGVDPAFRTGCKLAVVDETGRLLDLAVIYPHAPQKQTQQAAKTIREIVHRFQVQLISIGNGTASRETERFIAEIIPQLDHKVSYTIVNEAGASVYSASQVAGDEFPELDLSQRSAISIARRLQDPLSELVKIEPKAIGVGQYQHDVNQKLLEKQLDGVVESVVNHVGVDLNTASVSLLQHIAGIKGNVAKNIVSYREQNGPFNSRAELKKVPRLGEATFIQAAGFLRITNGKEPLDNTSVHPESYGAAKTLIELLGYKASDLGRLELANLPERIMTYSPEDLAERLQIGLPTLKDMLEALTKPGRDPRGEAPEIVFSNEVLEITDLKIGMILKGVVRNVVDFGCFVDIGLHDDGLVHISELSPRRVKHPIEVVRVGQIVRVKVIDIDITRKRIALSIRQVVGESNS